MKMNKIISMVAILGASLILYSCNSITGKTGGKTDKVTFIELGSVKCIPCRKMQSVMDSIEKNYGAQVKVLFYDVWTREGKPYGEQYKIHLIPTQVFLDKNGKEYYRHEGYFPYDQVKRILNKQGVK